MRDARVLCLPSVSEGFGLPVAEAMACGTPCVTSDRGALPEVLADGGVAVAPEPAQLAAALRKVLDNRSVYAEQALRRAQDFSWERTASRVHEALIL